MVTALPCVYFSARENTGFAIQGELKSLSGDIQLVYVNPDNEETVVAENQGSKNKTLKIDTDLSADKGNGRLEFRSQDASFKFKIAFENVDKRVFKYFTASRDDAEAAMFADGTTPTEAAPPTETANMADPNDTTQYSQAEVAFGNLLNEETVPLPGRCGLTGFPWDITRRSGRITR